MKAVIIGVAGLVTLIFTYMTISKVLISPSIIEVIVLQWFIPIMFSLIIIIAGFRISKNKW